MRGNFRSWCQCAPNNSLAFLVADDGEEESGPVVSSISKEEQEKLEKVELERVLESTRNEVS